MERILNNFTMLDVVAGLGVAKEGVVDTPKQVFVGDAATLAAGGDDANTGSQPPVSLITKPIEVDASTTSHDLCLVYRWEAFAVLQEFVNHDVVLFRSTWWAATPPASHEAAC
jgi:inositol-1,3,4-trisphosphate 5/6-kinase/inositol-tetrakisphosphate 1-kinase